MLRRSLRGAAVVLSLDAAVVPSFGAAVVLAPGTHVAHEVDGPLAPSPGGLPQEAAHHGQHAPGKQQQLDGRPLRLREVAGPLLPDDVPPAAAGPLGLLPDSLPKTGRRLPHGGGAAFRAVLLPPGRGLPGRFLRQDRGGLCPPLLPGGTGRLLFICQPPPAAVILPLGAGLFLSIAHILSLNRSFPKK